MFWCTFAYKDTLSMHIESDSILQSFSSLFYLSKNSTFPTLISQHFTQLYNLGLEVGISHVIPYTTFPQSNPSYRNAFLMK